MALLVFWLSSLVALRSRHLPHPLLLFPVHVLILLSVLQSEDIRESDNPLRSFPVSEATESTREV